MPRYHMERTKLARIKNDSTDNINNIINITDGNTDTTKFTLSRRYVHF